MTLDERINLLLETKAFFEPFTGSYDAELLKGKFTQQVPSPTARPPKKILHIVSGNTPHAACQSILHGLLLGAYNLLKLPQSDLLDFHLPDTLRPWVDARRDLPDSWLSEADAVVVFGNDDTIRYFQTRCPLGIPFVGHGHRVGVALITDPSPVAAERAARDIAQFDQMGCLSLQTIFAEEPRAFGPLLAAALENEESKNPRGPLTLSEAGSISHLREEIRYLIAQEPDAYALWHSQNSTAWTIIYDHSPHLSLSPGFRTVFLRPLLPETPDLLSKIPYLSGIGLHPFDPRSDLPSPRLFPLGQAQTPPPLWAHDGILPLASLISHQTIQTPNLTTF